MPATPGLTIRDLTEALGALGLAAGDAVEVHSSLSSLGHVAGGAETVVDALMAVVDPQGAIVMSAFNISRALPLTDAEREAGIVTKVRWMPDDYVGPTGMGAVADAFRARSDVLVGPGEHRVAAWGCEAAQHSQSLDYLLAHDGKALLIGTGIHTLTAMHYAEHVGVPAEVSAYWEAGKTLRRQYGHDYYLNCGSTPDDGWQKVFDEAQQRGLVQSGLIGQAQCYLLDVAPVVAIYEDALRTDPLGLFGIVG